MAKFNESTAVDVFSNIFQATANTFISCVVHNVQFSCSLAVAHKLVVMKEKLRLATNFSLTCVQKACTQIVHIHWLMLACVNVCTHARTHTHMRQMTLAHAGEGNV